MSRFSLHPSSINVTHLTVANHSNSSIHMDITYISYVKLPLCDSTAVSENILMVCGMGNTVFTI